MTCWRPWFGSRYGSHRTLTHPRGRGLTDQPWVSRDSLWAQTRGSGVKGRAWCNRTGEGGRGWPCSIPGARGDVALGAGPRRAPAPAQLVHTGRAVDTALLVQQALSSLLQGDGVLPERAWLAKHVLYK